MQGENLKLTVYDTHFLRSDVRVKCVCIYKADKENCTKYEIHFIFF